MLVVGLRKYQKWNRFTEVNFGGDFEMKKLLIYLLFLIGPGIGMVLAYVTISAANSEPVLINDCMRFFVYGVVAGVILLLLRLLVRGGTLN